MNEPLNIFSDNDTLVVITNSSGSTPDSRGDFIGKVKLKPMKSVRVYGKDSEVPGRVRLVARYNQAPYRYGSKKETYLICNPATLDELDKKKFGVHMSGIFESMGLEK